MMRKNDKSIEMRIYELLGVNIFRKYILFTWEKIAKLLRLPIGYRLDELSVEGCMRYKMMTKAFAIAHLIMYPCLAIYAILLNPTAPLWHIMLWTILNTYCIITQRYTTLRINRIIKKMELRQKRQTNINNDVVEKDSALTLEHGDPLTVKENKSLSNDSDIELLKQYRETLVHTQDKRQTTKEIEYQIDKNKSNLFEDEVRQKSR